jgi:hypothetical protein
MIEVDVTSGQATAGQGWTAEIDQPHDADVHAQDHPDALKNVGHGDVNLHDTHNNDDKIEW